MYGLARRIQVRIDRVEKGNFGEGNPIFATILTVSVAQSIRLHAKSAGNA
jgi:DNA-binding phage protein